MQEAEVLPVELVEDFTFYPRLQVDDVYVGRLAEAIRAGETLPPPVVARGRMVIVDGFHRVRAHRRVLGDTVPIRVFLKDYPDDRAIFLDAVRLNAAHGKRLAPAEEVRCALKAQELDIKLVTVAQALGLREEVLIERLRRSTALGPDGAVPLKTAMQALAGRRLNAEQLDANRKVGGRQAAECRTAGCQPEGGRPAGGGLGLLADPGN